VLFITGGDPAKVFQSVDESFHDVPELVTFRVVPSISMTLTGRDDWTTSLGTDRLAKCIAVVSFVGNDMLSSNPFEQRFGFRHVVALAAGQAKIYWRAIAADGDMNFRAESTAGPSQ
jgi:hypothetical protein